MMMNTLINSSFMNSTSTLAAFIQFWSNISTTLHSTQVVWTFMASLPWMWILNWIFIMMTILLPNEITLWQSDAYTSNPVANFGSDNFVMQSVTGYVYHQVPFNTWSHVLTFPFDLTWWALYLNYYSEMWFGDSILMYTHYAICVMQLITVCFRPQSTLPQQEVAASDNLNPATSLPKPVTSASSAPDSSTSNLRDPAQSLLIPPQQLQPQGNHDTSSVSTVNNGTTTTVATTQETPQQEEPFSFRDMMRELYREFYFTQFLVVFCGFTFWYIVLQMLLPAPTVMVKFFCPQFIFDQLPTIAQTSDIFWLNIFIAYNVIFRVLGHCADYLPPIMFLGKDLPFTSIGQGFAMFGKFRSWRWVLQIPFAYCSELCAGYPGRLFAWRMLADVRVVLNYCGVDDRKQINFFTLNWFEVDHAKDLINLHGWNSWSPTSHLFEAIEKGHVDDSNKTTATTANPATTSTDATTTTTITTPTLSLSTNNNESNKDAAEQ
ncbi:hypothetical protein C9374_001563 [Naegleria lovaniensis]|uniref:Transmembrane protein n=1 Tax=Naegleria lovaniensis TaxID=51637 RepID=A0AA88GWJ9_NAELO|nr:uncharacterized protein C9374_001563 [Naegleria lovaniensis]KAG2387231.1 hypothetical protein C9374_001563 [Naegleria lovaniensis]